MKKNKLPEYIVHNIYCPITRMIFLNPVNAQDGYVYEEKAIKKWFSTKNTSPMTGKIIEKIINPVYPIKSMITEILNQYPKLEKEQYVEEKLDHCKNKINVNKIITSSKFNKLQCYENFDMEELLKTKIEGSKSLVNHITEFAPFEIQKYIVDNCKDLNTTTHKGNKLIHYATENANLNFIKYLVDMKKVNIFQTNDDNNIRPIHIACKQRDEEIVNFFVNLHEIDLECETSSLYKPIHYLCQNKKISSNALEQYINKGMSVDRCTANGSFPIHQICRQLNKSSTVDFTKKIKLVIDNTSNLECEDSDGWRAIHHICASKAPSNRELLEYLVEKGVSINCETSTGHRPIHLLDSNNITLIMYLINKGALPVDFTGTDLSNSSLDNLSIGSSNCNLSYNLNFDSNNSDLDSQDNYYFDSISSDI